MLPFFFLFTLKSPSCFVFAVSDGATLRTELPRRVVVEEMQLWPEGRVCALTDFHLEALTKPLGIDLGSKVVACLGEMENPSILGVFVEKDFL